MVAPLVLNLAGGVLGAVLPSMVSSILGAKTEDEARASLAPKREQAIARLMGQGVPRLQASQQVDEALKGEIEKEMSKGALPPWAEIGLSLLGGIGGGAAGGKVGGILAKKAAAKTAATEAAAASEAAAKKLAAQHANPATMPPGPSSPFPRALDVDLDQAELAFASRSAPALSLTGPFPDLPPGLLPEFARHATGMRTADLADIASRMNRY